MFLIKADGDKIHRGDLVKDTVERTYDFELAGIRELEMIVEDGGNGASGDWRIWFDPRLSL